MFAHLNEIIINFSLQMEMMMLFAFYLFTDHKSYFLKEFCVNGRMVGWIWSLFQGIFFVFKFLMKQIVKSEPDVKKQYLTNDLRHIQISSPSYPFQQFLQNSFQAINFPLTTPINNLMGSKATELVLPASASPFKFTHKRLTPPKKVLSVISFELHKNA